MQDSIRVVCHQTLVVTFLLNQPFQDALVAQDKLAQTLHHAEPLVAEIFDRLLDQILIVESYPFAINFVLLRTWGSRRWGKEWAVFHRLVVRWRLSMSMTESTVQKVPVRPQPALQCTTMGRASGGSGSEKDECVVLRTTASHCSTRPKR